MGADPLVHVLRKEQLREARKAVSSEVTLAIIELGEEGYKQTEIAEMLGISLKAVESRLVRHRTQIKHRGTA